MHFSGSARYCGGVPPPKNSPMTDTVYRLLLADDHAFVRRAMRSLLEMDPALRVVAEASSLKQTMRELRRQAFDLLIMDLVFPGEDGLRFIAEARRDFPRLGILVVSLHRESLFAEPVMRAGANGFIMKSDAPDLLVPACRAVLERRFFVSPMMRQLLMERAPGTRGETSPAVTGVPICGPAVRPPMRRAGTRRTRTATR